MMEALNFISLTYKMGLESYITAVAGRYRIKPIISIDSRANQAFLAILHHYTNKVAIKMPPVVTAADIGCGNMPYFDGLYTFLHQEGREVHLLGVESGDDYPLDWSPITSQQLSGVKLHWTPEYIGAGGLAFLRNQYQLQKLNMMTLFAPGPDPKMMLARTLADDTKFQSWVDEGRYATNLLDEIAPHLDDRGIVMVTVAEGGVPKERLKQSLLKAGLQMAIDEPNIFTPYVNALGYDHREIMIAQKKK